MNSNLKNRLPKNVLIWGGWYGSRNFGDRALLISIIDALVGKQGGEFNFIVPTAKPELVREYLSDINTDKISLIQTQRQFFKLLRTFPTLDKIVFGGAVPFYDDILHNTLILVFSVASKLFNIPVIFWSVSSQRIYHKYTKFAISQIIKRAVFISVRDEATKKMLILCGANPSEVLILPDPAFGMKKDRSRRSDFANALLEGKQRGERYFALFPRSLRPSDGEAHTHYLPASLERSIRSILIYSTIVDYLVQVGFIPVFIPMNIDEPDDDRIAAQEIISNSKLGSKARVLNESYMPKDLNSILEQVEGAFVSRVHGAISSINAGVPVIMYAFDQKHVGLMQAMGLDDFCFMPDTMAPDDAVRMVQKVLDDLENYKQVTRKIAEISAQKCFPENLV